MRWRVKVVMRRSGVDKVSFGDGVLAFLDTIREFP